MGLHADFIQNPDPFKYVIRITNNSLISVAKRKDLAKHRKSDDKSIIQNTDLIANKIIKLIKTDPSNKFLKACATYMINVLQKNKKSEKLIVLLNEALKLKPTVPEANSKLRKSTTSTSKYKLRLATHKIIQMIGKRVEVTEALPSRLKTLKLLSSEYWKEFFDKSKRHPAALDKFFNEWKIYGHSEKMSFQEYLSNLEAAGKIQADPSKEVIYLQPNERKKYEVTLEMNKGSMILKDATGQSLHDGVYITVLGPDHKFYAAKKQPGKFQHATFFAGQAIVSAGMFVIQNGVVKNFVSHSGHYKPEKEEMFKALFHMEKKGIDISKIHLVYSSGGEEPITIENPKNWPEYLDFKAGRAADSKLVASKRLLEEIPNTHRIDRAIGKMVNKRELGGGSYSISLKAIMPANPMQVQMQWEQMKNKIARVVNILPFPVNKESMLWDNTASSISEILSDAKKLSPIFQKICRDVANIKKCRVNYGPNDKCIIKSEESLTRKVKQDAHVMGISETDSLKKIGDALRGTLIVKRPSEIASIVDLIAKKVKDIGGSIVVKNLWAEDRLSGYVGVHAKILLPVPVEKGEKQKYLIVELQIHLKAVMDGTENCAKERQHLIYENVRTAKFNPLEVSAASKLIYLTAMDRIKLDHISP